MDISYLVYLLNKLFLSEDNYYYVRIYFIWDVLALKDKSFGGAM
jgi:hypothetical protein